MSPSPAASLGTAAAVARLRGHGLKISKRQLEEHRRRKTGPRCTRGLRNQAFYDPADVDRWAAEQRGIAVEDLDRTVISALPLNFSDAAMLIEQGLRKTDVPHAPRTFRRHFARGLAEHLGAYKTGGRWRVELGRVNELIADLADAPERFYRNDPATPWLRVYEAGEPA